MPPRHTKQPMCRSLKLLAALLLTPIALPAQTNTSATVGEVSFANSGPAAAQPDFLYGLAQLHNFEYADAALHFRRAEEIDPAFAMAYWGEAMTKNHGIWHEQDLSGAREVLQRLAPTPEARLAKALTSRERQYLATVEILYGQGSKDDRDQKYADAMFRLHRNFPEDVDAAALYALAILSSAENGRDFATYMRAAAVLEEIFPRHPRHPGVVHYLIHSYDDPIHAPLGLRAARVYAQLAPEAGHAQHMTSHIFLAMGMWDDVVKANETAVAVVNRQRAAAGKPPRNCGHYNYWLEYGYLQQGRVADARRILGGCRQEAQGQAASLSANPQATADPDTSSIGSYAAMRANFLIDSELWQDDVVRWTLPAGNYPFAQLTMDYTDALVAYRTSNFAAAKEALAHMEDDLRRANAGLDAEHSNEPNERNRVAILVDQLRALLSSPKSPAPQSVSLLQPIVAKEHAMPLEFGPPFIYKPTDELQGELYLQLGRPAEARESFQSDLARAPGRRLAARGLAQSQQQISSATDSPRSPKPSGAGNHVRH